jgi:hypothetical protein
MFTGIIGGMNIHNVASATKVVHVHDDYTVTIWEFLRVDGSTFSLAAFHEGGMTVTELERRVIKEEKECA